MTQLQQPPYNRPFIDENNVLTTEGRVFFTDLVQRVPSYGSGSPEGVVDAVIGATYYDLDASAGLRHYIKINADIGGDTTQGWELA